MRLLMDEHCPAVRAETRMQVKAQKPVGAWLAREGVVSFNIDID